jgi:hypothetical protein
MLKLLDQQFSLEHRYYNQLVRLELDQRAEIRECRLRHSTELDAATKRLLQLDAERAEIRKTIKKSKGHGAEKVNVAPLRERIKDINKEHKDLGVVIREIKASLKPSDELAAQIEAIQKTDDPMVALEELYRTEPHVAVQLAIINANFDARRKELYADSPLFWGTKNHCFARLEAAKKKTDPSFRRWSRNGLLYCQVMNGIPADDAFSCKDTRIQIERLPRGERSARDFAATGKQEASAFHPKLCKIRMRIGSVERNPLWAELVGYVNARKIKNEDGVKTQEYFPPGAQIMGVQICRREITRYRRRIDPNEVPIKLPRGTPHNRYLGEYAPLDKWSVQFTLRIPSTVRQIPAQPRAVAIDLGWRMMKSTRDLRVGFWHDTDNKCGSFVLPRDLTERMLKTRDLISIRQKNFNAAIATLKNYLENAIAVPPLETCRKMSDDGMRTVEVPAQDTLANLCQWKSIERLSRLVQCWPPHPGDEGVYLMLTQWRDQEMHLHQWQKFNEIKSQAIRKDLFRNWAAKLYKEYDLVIMEDMDVAEMRRNAAPEEEEADFLPVFWRNAAAIGLLRQTITNRCAVRLRPTAKTTVKCNQCGTENEWNRVRLWHRCVSCEALWDQDDNASINLLSDGLNAWKEEYAKDTGPAEGEGVYKGRWQRRAETKKGKEKP